MPGNWWRSGTRRTTAPPKRVHEKAIRFYSGYLDSERADEYLPRVMAQVLEGKLDAFGKRIGRQLFKQAVDENLMANLVAFYFEMDEDMLQKLQGEVREKCKGDQRGD